MDYSEICQGWIYYIKNKVNGKMYIGRTLNFIDRKWQHFNREQCPILKKAFEKYGNNSFEMKPILIFSAINKNVCNTVLNWLEKYYIEKYDTYLHGYNATKGGDGTCGNVLPEESKKAIGKAQKEYRANEWLNKEIGIECSVISLVTHTKSLL